MKTLRRLFTLANAFKEGDLPVGGTRDDAVRRDARQDLLHTRVADIRRAGFVNDGVSEVSQGITETTEWEAPLFRLFDDILKHPTAGLLAVCHSFGLV